MTHDYRHGFSIDQAQLDCVILWPNEFLTYGFDAKRDRWVWTWASDSTVLGKFDTLAQVIEATNKR